MAWIDDKKRSTIWFHDLDNRENIPNIRQNHKLHPKYHGKLINGIDSGKTNPRRRKNSMGRLLRRFALVTAIRYNNNVTQLRT